VLSFRAHRTGVTSRLCHHRGTVGWVLRTQGIDVAKYKYFIFMNSSARGPFLPSYWPNTMHWTQPFVSRLRGLVKLVGPTISCEGERHLLGHRCRVSGPACHSAYLRSVWQFGFERCTVIF